jgi:hypothetical protein
MAESFETATVAKQTARWTDVINSEIAAIEERIAEAVAEGKFTTVVDGTEMTEPYVYEETEPNGDGYTDNYRYEYYKVWKQEVENMPCQDAMNQVIQYFHNKKYAISRQTNPYTKNSFFWIVSWS